MLKLVFLSLAVFCSVFSFNFAQAQQYETNSQPVMPAPLPQLPPPLAEQALPYPIEFIDRPYTLPVGLHDVAIRSSVVSVTDAEEVVVPVYLVDFKYRQPLTNDFSLVWNPFPLGILHQPKRTDDTVTGVSWSVGYQYQGNFGVLPQFQSFRRQKLNRSSAIEMELTYFTFIPFKKAGSVWSGSFRIGPLFQQSAKFALSPRIMLAVDNITLSQAYGYPRTMIENTLLTTKKAHFHFPFSLWFGYAFRPMFDVTLEYTLLGSGLGQNQYVHIGTLGGTLRW
jgi:hypothetical protein